MGSGKDHTVTELHFHPLGTFLCWGNKEKQSEDLSSAKLQKCTPSRIKGIKSPNIQHARLDTWDNNDEIHLAAPLKIHTFNVTNKEEGTELFFTACPGLTAKALGQLYLR